MPNLDVIHRHGNSLSISADGQEIARYVYVDNSPEVECRKPYMHPVRTLGGALTTAFRPWDHPWHKGVQMTWTNVSGQNFWGGYSYVHGKGYIPVDNVGCMEHLGFDRIEVSETEVLVVERLSWRIVTGEVWFEEERTLRYHNFDVASGAWTLSVHIRLQNVSGAAQTMSSPTAEGREDAGYTGFFWRGPRSFSGATLLMQDPADAEKPMGSFRSEWAAFDARLDEIDAHVTVILQKGTSSRGQLHWFLRNGDYACANPSPAFFEKFVLEDQGVLELSHGMIFADGAWDRDRIERHVANIERHGRGA